MGQQHGHIYTRPARLYRAVGSAIGVGGTGAINVSSITVMGEIVSSTVGAPATANIRMNTNGRVIRVTWTGAAQKVVNDITKILVDVSIPGWDTAGNQVTRTKTIGIRSMMHKPWNDYALISPDANGSVDLVLQDDIYLNDATWRYTITGVRFLAGWITGFPAESIIGSSVIRADSRPFPQPIIQVVDNTYRRNPTSWDLMGGHHFARDNLQFACVKGWHRANGVDGPVATAATMANSRHTPTGGTTPSGLPVPSYNLAPVNTGLTDDPNATFRYEVYPWEGPKLQSWVNPFAAAWPTLNNLSEIPFCLDTAGKYAPIYGYLWWDPANSTALTAAGKTLIASNTNVATVDVSGLATTQAAALASNKVYADYATLLTAVRRVNRSATSLTLASGAYTRPATHDTLAGAVGVMADVAGSTAGADANSYAIRLACSSQASFPPGPVPAVLRSETGLPTVGARLRGQLPDGSTPSLANKGAPSRILLKGLYVDGVGTTSTGNIAIDGTVAGQAVPAGQTALATVQFQLEDVIIRENAGAGTANVAVYRSGFRTDIRVDQKDLPGTSAMGVMASYWGGLVWSVGSYYWKADSTSVPVAPLSLYGCRTKNIYIQQQDKGTQPDAGTTAFINVLLTFIGNASSPLLAYGMNRPLYGGLLLCNVFAYQTGGTFGGPSISIAADGARYDLDYVVMQNVGNWTDRGSVGDGRLNFSYNDQGRVYVKKDFYLRSCAVTSYNVKWASFDAPEFPQNAAQGGIWSAGTGYRHGDIVWDSAPSASTVFYQCVATPNTTPGATYDVLGGLLSDASAWLNLGLIYNVKWGRDPLRHGNIGTLYWQNFDGVIGCAAHSTGVPGEFSGYGIAPGEAARGCAVEAVVGDLYTNPAINLTTIGNIFTAKATGTAPLKNKVAAGLAPVPFYIDGTAMPNDGSASAGAWL